VEQLAQAYQDLEIRITPPLDGHPALVQVLLDRVGVALSDWK